MRAALMLAAAGLAMYVVAGCDVDEDAGFFDFDVGPGGMGGVPDMGDVPDVGGTPDAGCLGTLTDTGVCVDVDVDDPASRCAALERVGCADEDGDCWAGGCPANVRADLVGLLRDCDDRRPATHKGAEELCNDRDDDCDGAIDEGYDDLGDACEVCGVAGKQECALNDPRATACSTAFGQSAAPPPGTREEVCDGVDDDCDGQTDERCRVPLPAGPPRSAPRVCGDRLLVVEDGALVQLRPGDGWAATTVHDGDVAFPACSPAGAAWLTLDGDATCETPEGGPLRCVGARLWVQAADGVPAARTGLGELGPPQVGDEAVYWHAIVGDRPTLHRGALTGGVEPLHVGEALSDPTPPVDGRVAVRAWANGQADVRLRALDADDDLLPRQAGAAPGPPALSAGWIVWPVGATVPSLWAVPRSDPREGFQLTDATGGQRGPVLDGDRVVWLDESTRPATLRWFDLQTGRAETVTRAPIRPGDYDVAGGVVVWVADEGDGPAVYHHRLDGP